MEEQKINTTISPNNHIKSSSYLYYSSFKNISKVNKSIYLDFDDELNYRKKFNSIDKPIYIWSKTANNNINKIEETKSNIKTCENEINRFISNKTIDIIKKKIQCKVNKLSFPVNTISNFNNNEKLISKQKKGLELKNNAESFSQNIDNVNIMKEKPPKLPELFCHDYTFNDKLIEKSNETSGKLNQGSIPVAFYNHLFISKQNKKIVNNKHKYFRTSLTQRNKKKMLTVIYYSP